MRKKINLEKISDLDTKKAKKEALFTMFTAGFEKAKTILLADDETTAREVVKLLLESQGYAVITAVNGEDAVNKFHEQKESIDMLLFDVVMPVMNGKDAHDAIKKIKPDVKALLMSGYTKDIISNNDLQTGGLNFLQKPVFPDTLFEKINEILDA